MELRPYQLEAVARSIEFLKNGPANAVYNASEPGLGKSAISIRTCDEMNFKRILVVCPAIMRLTWADEFKTWGRARVVTPVLSRRDLPISKDTEVLVLSYNHISEDDIRALVLKFKPEVMILDEAHYCLDQNTPILTPKGLTAIKDLKVGDSVTSVSNNGLRESTIINIFERTSDVFYEIHLESGVRLKCLDFHRIHLADGTWKFAKDLQISDKVSVVREDLFRSLSKLGEASEILQSPMCEESSCACRGLERGDEGKQSHAKSRDTQKGLGKFASNKTRSRMSGGKRTAHANSVSKIKEAFKNFVSQTEGFIRFSCEARSPSFGIPYLLQNRFCNSKFEDRNRSGRKLPFSAVTQTTGYEKRPEIAVARVVSIEIQKSNDNGGSGNRFMDIELNKNFNYIAEGIVVHNCKSSKAVRTKAILRHIWPSVPYRILLSGTPFTNSVTDCYSVFSRCLPNTLGTYHEFGKRFAVERRTPWGVKYEGIKDSKTLSELIREHFFIRYWKKDVLTELPDKVFQKVTLPAKYSVKEYEKELMKLTFGGEDISKLQTVPEHLMGLLRLQGELKVEPIVEYVKELLEQKLPVVLFGVNKAVIKKYVDSLGDYNPSVITGDTPPLMRDVAIKRFQAGDTDLFIGNIQAAGVGITLTRSSHCILGQITYSPADLEQAVDRLHRIGQKNSVNIFYFCTENSIDEKILRVVRSKAETFRKVLAA